MCAELLKKMIFEKLHYSFQRINVITVAHSNKRVTPISSLQNLSSD